MKKLCVCLALLLILIGTFGCAKEEEIVAPILSVGYGKADITPTTSLPLDGYGTTGANAAKNRWSTAQETPFSAICIAFTDADDKTVLFMTLDLLNAYMADGMRDAISKDTGVPKEQIMFQCTHNHSGPALRMSSKPEVAEYLGQLTQGVLEAARAALADRKPATQMFTTFSRPEGINSVRHYLLENGTYAGDNFGSFKSAPIVGHASIADNLLQLVKFTREGGKDVVMVNWQAHPRSTDPKTIATANYPGVLREYLEENMDCQAIFILGGSGNLNSSSRIKGEIRHTNYQEHGQLLGEEAMKAAENFTPMQMSKLYIQELVAGVSTYSGIQKKVWVYGISVGDFALVTAPFEIFDTNAVAVREASPYQMTFYASCCNGSNSYLPTPPSYHWETRSYEAATGKWPEGAAEELQDQLIGLLQELYTTTENQKAEKPEGYLQPVFVPATDGVIYQNPTPEAAVAYTQVENGYYQFVLKNGDADKTLLTRDPELIEKLQGLTQIKLIFDEQNVVVGLG